LSDTETVGFWLDLAVGIVTVVSLIWAIRTALGAEKKALAMAANERRRLFELEILRDLAELTADDAMMTRTIEIPLRLYRRVRPQLAMLCTTDLPKWRALETISWERLDRLAAVTGLQQHISVNEPHPTMPFNMDFPPYELPRSMDIIDLMRESLLADVLDAIEKRMQHNEAAPPT